MKLLFEFHEDELIGIDVLEIDVVGIGAIIGISIAAITLIKNYFQTKKQTRVESANLILKLKEPWKKKNFKEFLRKLQDKDTKDIPPIETEEFLNQLEDIAVFWNDHTITDNHVKEFFGVNFKKINENTSVKKIYDEFRNLNPDYNFINIHKLLKKIDKWKI